MSPQQGHSKEGTKRGEQTARSRTRNSDKSGPKHGGEGRRQRNARGQYVERMTETEILALFERLRGPVIATTDVAEHFDSTTEGARRKLNDLCDTGLLDRRKVGGTRVYWRTDRTGETDDAE